MTETRIDTEASAQWPLDIAQRMGTPDYVDWHLILDNELTRLTRPETGVIGSFGLTGLGAALGLAPSVVSVVQKFNNQNNHITYAILTLTDVITLGIFLVGSVTALICLTIFGLYWWRNKDLAKVIRARKKRTVSGAAAS